MYSPHFSGMSFSEEFNDGLYQGMAKDDFFATSQDGYQSDEEEKERTYDEVRRAFGIHVRECLETPSPDPLNTSQTASAESEEDELLMLIERGVPKTEDSEIGVFEEETRVYNTPVDSPDPGHQPPKPKLPDPAYRCIEPPPQWFDPNTSISPPAPPFNSPMTPTNMRWPSDQWNQLYEKMDPMYLQHAQPDCQRVSFLGK